MSSCVSINLYESDTSYESKPNHRCSYLDIKKMSSYVSINVSNCVALIMISRLVIYNTCYLLKR